MAEFPALLLAQDGWLSPDTYSNAFARTPRASGVYLLEGLDDDFKSIGIAYIGQAQDLKRRLGNHEILNELRCRFNFVRRWFKQFPIENIRKIERDLIQFYDPPFNIIGRRRGF